MSRSVIEKLRAVGERRLREESVKSPVAPGAGKTDASPTASTRGNGQAEPLSAAVELLVPGLDGPVWLVPSRDWGERLGLERGAWLVPEDLLILETLDPPDRMAVLRYMQATGFPAAMAPVRWRNHLARRLSAGES
jgi:hypothetical protein